MNSLVETDNVVGEFYLKALREDRRAKAELETYNQRLATIAKTHPAVFTDPKILACHVAQAEAQEGMA